MAEEIKIIDNATPWLLGMADAKPDWERKALKSVGWMMRKEIRAGIKSGAPGGQKYTDGMNAARRRAFDAEANNNRNNPFDNTKRRPLQSYKPLGHLVNAIGYEYKPQFGSTMVGWLSRSAVRVGTWQEKGVSQSLTDDMRKFYWALGIPISAGKHTVVIPARPTFEPMMRVLEPKIMPWIEEKFIEYANSGAPERKARRSKYRVRG